MHEICFLIYVVVDNEEETEFGVVQLRLSVEGGVSSDE